MSTCQGWNLLLLYGSRDRFQLFIKLHDGWMMDEWMGVWTDDSLPLKVTTICKIFMNYIIHTMNMSSLGYCVEVMFTWHFISQSLFRSLITPLHTCHIDSKNIFCSACKLSFSFLWYTCSFMLKDIRNSSKPITCKILNELIAVLLFDCLQWH